MSDDFKKKLDLYKMGTLEESEAVEIEEEIEKYLTLKEYLCSNDAELIKDIKQELDSPIAGEDKIGRKINWKINLKIVKLSLITIIICLIALTILGISTASIVGKMFRLDSNRFVQEENFAGQFFQMVSPNLNYLRGSNHTEFYKQSFEITFLTGISRKSPTSTIELNYSFGRLQQPAETSDKPLKIFSSDSFYALNKQAYIDNKDWDYLEEAPAGTNSQILITFKSKLTPQQAKDAIGKQYFGLNSNFKTDMFINTDSTIVLRNTYSPVYYYEKNNSSVSKSNEREFIDKFYEYDNDTHKEVFVFGLNEIKQYKNVADFITTNYSYKREPLFKDIDQMISYIDKNGVQYVGALISGDTKELLKLKNNPEIYSCRVEDIVVW